MPNTMRFSGLTGNQLKLLAMAAMTCDHVGVMLLPQFPILRIIGRLAFPIYAFMIEEGCRHTRSKARYLATMAGFAAACQVFYFVAMGSLYQSVLVTFTLSIFLICLPSFMQRSPLVNALAAMSAGFLVLFLCEGLPFLLPGTDYAVDYGIAGVLLPVLVYYGRDRNSRLILLALGLLGLCLRYGGIQWWCLAAFPLLAMYNGQRGKAKMKYLFYIYYPAHMALIYLLGLFL